MRVDEETLEKLVKTVEDFKNELAQYRVDYDDKISTRHKLNALEQENRDLLNKISLLESGQSKATADAIKADREKLEADKKKLAEKLKHEYNKGYMQAYADIVGKVKP